MGSHSREALRHSSAPPPRPVSALRLAIAALVITLATLAVYAPVRDFPFLSWDDDIYVTGNPSLREPISWNAVVRVFREPYLSNWTPLMSISLHIDATLFGFEPAAYHVENVLLHLATSLVLLLAFARATGALAPSAFVAAVFALHPVHVESVAWVSQRKDCLSGLFFACAIAAHFAYARRPGALRYALLLAAAAAALLAKPMAVTLPLVLLLLDAWPLGRLGVGFPELRVEATVLRRAIVEKLPIFAFALVAGGLTLLAQRSAGSIELLQIPLSWRIMNALNNYAVYIGMAFWPSGLAYYYTWPLDAWLPWKAGAALLATTLLTLAALAGARRQRAWIVGWLWYLITLLPVVGFVQVGMQARADRYLYLPLVGLSLSLAFGLPALLRGRERLLAVAGGAAVLALALASAAQVQHWRSGLALYARALAVTDENFFAHFSYAGELLRTGGDVAEATLHYEEALRIRPRWYQPHIELARVRAQSGALEAALELVERAGRLRPAAAEPWLRQAELLVGLGRRAEAIERIDAALGVVAPEQRRALERARTQIGAGDP